METKRDELNREFAGSDAEIEQEYLRMLDSEVPDLWNRIEAGLDAADNSGSYNVENPGSYNVENSGSYNVENTGSYNAESFGTNTGADARYATFQQQEEQAANVVSMETAAKKRASKGRRYAFWIGGIAAAAVVILLSVFLIGRFDREKKSYADDTIEYAKYDGADTASTRGNESSKTEPKQEDAAEAVLDSDDVHTINGGASKESEATAENSSKSQYSSDKAKTVLEPGMIPKLGLEMRVKEVLKDSIVLTFGYKGEIRDLKAASAKIDYDNSGTWVSLANDLPILEGDPSIKEKAVTELSVMLKESLPRGRYRIHVSLSDSREAKLLVGSDDQLEIVAEFTVK